MAYHKRPTLLATSFDLLTALVCAGAVVMRDQIQVVHARSYVPAVVAWMLKRLLGMRFIFDMRGFWADERVEASLWPSKGVLYRVVKRLEHRFLRDADKIVTLTERARLTVERWPGIEASRVTVIPTCVDLARFAGPADPRPPKPSPVFVYTGSVGTWYLLDEMLRFVLEAKSRFPSTRFLLLGRGDGDIIAAALRRARLGPETVTVASVASGEVPAWLARAHAGLAFYKPGWSRQATSPTKIGEYLAMGLPVVVNDAVGDMKEVIGTGEVGAVLSEFSTDAYGLALDRLGKLWDDPTLASRCRRTAESRFSLETGVERYWAIYQRLA